MLSTIVGKAVQLSGTEAGAIYVFDNRQHKFHLRAIYGMDREFRRVKTVVSKSAVFRLPCMDRALQRNRCTSVFLMARGKHLVGVPKVPQCGGRDSGRSMLLH